MVESVVEETEDDEEEDVVVVVVLLLAISVAGVVDEAVTITVGDSPAGINPRFNACPARSPTENIAANATTIMTLLTAIFRRIIPFSTVLNEEKGIFEVCLSVFPNSIKDIHSKIPSLHQCKQTETNF